MKNLRQKKSAIDLTELAIGIVIIGIAVSIGAIILTKMGNNQITNAASYQVANESVSPTTSGTALSTAWVKSVNQVYNESNGLLFTSPNYTLTINPENGYGTLSNSTCTLQTGWTCTSWKVSYTVYNVSDVRYSLPNKASLGLGEYGNWFKILVIVGIASVILALIFIAFGNKGSQSIGTSY